MISLSLLSQTNPPPTFQLSLFTFHSSPEAQP